MNRFIKTATGVLLFFAALEPNCIRSAPVEPVNDIPGLILQLENPSSSKQAVSKLSRDPNSIPALIEILRSSKNENARSEAAYALGSFLWVMSELREQAEPASNALISSMSDESERVRCTSLVALGRVRPISTINAAKISESVLAQTKCSLGALEFAIDTLKETDPALGLKILSLLSDTSPHVRQQAASFLPKLKVPAEIAVPPLISALSDPDESVRFSAMMALNRYATPEALAAARKYMEGINKAAEAARPSPFSSLKSNSLLLTFSPIIWLSVLIAIVLLAVLSTRVLYRWPRTVAGLVAVIVFLHWPLAIAQLWLGNLLGGKGSEICFGIFEVIVSPSFIIGAFLQTIITPPPTVDTINLIIPFIGSAFWGITVYIVLAWYGVRKNKKTAASNQLINRPATQ